MPVTKSPNDKLEYRVITLNNGLKALLISALSSKTDEIKDSQIANADLESGSESSEGSEDDGGDEDNYDDDDEDDEEEGEDSEDEGSGKDDESRMKTQTAKTGEKMAAAGLCIGIGSFSDPDDLPGLAHFLEHMVFMGSKKYPDENAFDSFIKKHGGSDNASTDCEQTVFQFEIHGKYLYEALDRFAQFFICPLLKKDSTDREIEAVDSEFRMSLPSDTFRKQQLIGSFAVQGHPVKKFMWGNSQTLKTDPRKNKINVHKRLREFRERHYSSHYMTLAVQSRETLDTLEKWVREIFSEIPNNALPKPTFHHLTDPFSMSSYHKLYKVIPVKNCLQVELHWSLPCVMQHYHVKPVHYLSWLIGHEGKGSILSFLRKKVWALSLCSGNDESGFEYNSAYTDFQIQVGLTEEGFAHVFEVITVIHQYLQILRTLGAQEHIYKEIQIIEENDFRWQEETDAVEYVETLSENMHMYSEEDFITGDQLMFEYNADLIEKFQNMLTPDKCCIMLTSPSFEKENICVRTEPWFKTRYAECDIPREWMEKWSNLEPTSELFLPEINKFIATDFQIKLSDQEETDIPVKILDNEENRLWYKKDTKFNIPKAYTYFRLTSPIVNCSPESMVMLDLFVNVLVQNLKETVYPAEVAQLTCSLYGDEKGLVIKVHGFNHKLAILFETVLDEVQKFDVDEDLFSAMKNYLRKGYYNSFIKPSKLCKDIRLAILQEVHWTPVEKRAVVNNIARERLLSFVAEFRSHLFVEGLVQGNIAAEEAIQLNSLIRTKLQCSEIANGFVPEVRIIQLPLGEQYCRISGFNKDDSNSVVTNYYQSGPANIRKSCLMDLLMMFMEEPCFDILRTQEQLGYNVYCLCRCTFGILGFSVTVHTHADKFSTPYIDERIEAFLEVFRDKLAATTEKDFQTQVTSLIKLKECVDLHLKEEVDRNWDEILYANYVFGRLRLEIEALKTITLLELQRWYLQHVSVGDKSNFRKLGVHIVGQVKTPDETVHNHKRKSSQKNCESEQKTVIAQDILKGSKLKKNVASTDDEKMDFSYDFTVSTQWTKCEQTIMDIQQFKKGTTVYPVTKVTT